MKPLTVIDQDNGLPQYPLSREERLDGNSFVKWHVHRWLSSKTFKLASWEVQGMARALFDLCQTESPIGTLPNDDAELAFMLRCDARRLAELRRMEYGPLRNWRPCLCGNEVRLMHDMVLEQVQDALERRAIQELSKEQRAVEARLSRLRKGLAKEGLSKEVIADEVLIQRMDEWLAANHSRRTQAVYRSAILYAVQNRWIERGQIKQGFR